MNKRRILVTGGAGFIGSALVWHLNQMGIDEIIIADYLEESEKWRNLVPLRFKDYFEAGDLRERLESGRGSFGSFSHVFHLGACSATTEKNASYLAENNYRYTVDLATWAVATGTRFIYASSAATYGNGEAGMEDGSERIERLRPLNMYGYSKHLFDLYARRKGWFDRVVGLKYFNVFGPNEDHKGEMRSLVHKAFAAARDTGRISLFRSGDPKYLDGGQMRDFLYVKDAVAMTTYLGFEYTGGGLYNLGSGKARTWLDLAKALFAALGRVGDINFIDMPENLKGKYQYFTEAKIDRLRQAGYRSDLFTLEEAVKDYVQGYLIPDLRLGDERGPSR
ncbi:MAG: ADP-glyceromanno-heptose 6-epimerase [Puniceicoccaceae bacterium]